MFTTTPYLSYHNLSKMSTFRKYERKSATGNKGVLALGPKPRRVTSNEVIERGIPGFNALRYRTTLYYYDAPIIATGAAAAGTYVYSTNGLYDPDITSTGHQPMAFDQIMLSFDHYCVLKSTMYCSFRNNSTTYPLSCCVSLNGSPTAITDYTRLSENGTCVRDRLNIISASGSMSSLEMPCNVAKFGTVPSILSNPDYQGTVAANPVEQSYFHLSVWNPADATVTGSNCEIFIVYDVVFSEPRKNTVSVQTAIAQILREDENKNDCHFVEVSTNSNCKKGNCCKK
jgi:hypothetical protein